MALESTPLPQSQGSRLPPPPPVKTTFSGAGDQEPPYEQSLADQALRLIRSVNEVDPTELPSVLRGLRAQRERVEGELTRVRMIDVTPLWKVWLPFYRCEVDPQDAATLLLATLRALDESIGATEQRMRDCHVPQFVMELA